MTVQADRLDDLEAISSPNTYGQRMPLKEMARLRRTSKVIFTPEAQLPFMPPGPGYWSVLSHAESRQVLRDPDRFSARIAGTQIFDPPLPELVEEARQLLINMDPPQHTVIRKLLASSFTPKAVQHLVNSIEERADRIVGDLSGRGECDFVIDIASEMALQSLSDVLGVPVEDRWLMYDWANRVIGFLDPDLVAETHFDPTTASDMARVAEAARPQPDTHGNLPHPLTKAGMADLYVYAEQLGRHLRTHPDDGPMSAFLGGELADGQPPSLDEFGSLFWLFSIAGNETTRNGLGGGLACLLDHPEQYRKLVDDPSLLDSAIDEMLRFWTPVIHFRRTATTDCRLGGAEIGAGDKVVVFFASANRDPEVFDRPNEFDISRRPNDHLAFGYGTHYCIGAHLARAEMKAVFRAMNEQLGPVRAAGTRKRLTSNFQNGLKSLPIEWSGR